MAIYHNRRGQIRGNYLRCDLVRHKLLYLGMCLRGHFEESQAEGGKKTLRCMGALILPLYLVNLELSAIHSCLIIGLLSGAVWEFEALLLRY